MTGLTARAVRSNATPYVLLYSALALMVLVISACTPSLPEPQSSGARLYEGRCATCHRLYAPNLMTGATWKVILDRMQGEMRRRAIPPLNPGEFETLLKYLSRHALNSGASNDQG